jgi:hypothetical protein
MSLDNATKLNGKSGDTLGAHGLSVALEFKNTLLPLKLHLFPKLCVRDECFPAQ